MILEAACLYLVVGVVGFVYHFPELLAHQSDMVWAELTELVAIVCGVALLRGHGWARWLAVAWMAFHVVLSAFHSWQEAAMHAVLCVAIAAALFYPGAARYFRGAPSAHCET